MPTQRGAAPPAVDPLVVWRRIALDKQLPAPRFPGGIRAPSIVLFGSLLLLAAICAVYLGMFSGQVIPQAVVDSQRQLIGSLARSLETTVTTGATEMRQAAADAPAGSEAGALLQSAEGGATTWAGTAVLDTGRRPLASRGEPVPVGNLPQDVSRVTVTPLIQGGEARALVVAPLPDGRLLAGTTVLRVRQLRLAPDERQAVLVGLITGEHALAQGTAPRGKQTDELVRRVLGATKDGPTVRADGAAAGAAGSAMLVVAAPVGSFGMSVVSTMAAPVVDVGSRWKGVLPAAGLVLAAGLAYLVARAALVRPVHQLLEQAKAEACGDTLPRRPISGPSEVRRIAAALADEDKPRGVRAIVALLGVPAIIFGWSGGMAYTLGSSPADVPAQVVLDTENQITAGMAALGETLDHGLRQVSDAAQVGGDRPPEQLRPALERLSQTESRYRGLYVADAGGAVVVAAGRPPLRPAGPLPPDSGIRLANTGGRLPVVYVYAHRSDGSTVIAEFDVLRLSGLLKRMDGRVRVVDSELRTILDTEGFRAFQPLPKGPSRAAAATAFQGQTRAGVSGDTLVAGVPLGTPRSTTALNWSLVAEQPVRELGLPGNGLRRAGLVLGGGAAGLALLSLGWLYFVSVRPLERLAAAADSLADGDNQQVITPHRHDEIGAIASCLEICRQVWVQGPARLGGAERLRGILAHPTTVIRTIRRREAGRRRARRG